MSTIFMCRIPVYPLSYKRDRGTLKHKLIDRCPPLNAFPIYRIVVDRIRP